MQGCCARWSGLREDFDRLLHGRGLTPEDVALMRRTVGPDLGVKASGGVRNLEDMERMVAAGATRIGASSGVKIVQADDQTSAY